MQRNNNALVAHEGSATRFKELVPFYAVPACKKTSAEIISEARAAIGLELPVNMNPATNETRRKGTKAFSTKRPFTPREKQRTLFGPSNKISRPPSSIMSLSLHVDEEEDGEAEHAVRLPSLGKDCAGKTQHKNQLRYLRKIREEPQSCSVNLLNLGIVGTPIRRYPITSDAVALPKPAQTPALLSDQPLSAALLCQPQVAHKDSDRQLGVEGRASRTPVKSSKVKRPEEAVQLAKEEAVGPVNVSDSAALRSTETSPSISVDTSFEEVLSLANVLRLLAHQDATEEEVEATLRKMYAACERCDVLGRRQGSASVRGQLLRTLFLFVERPEQRVLLQLARLLLALQVMGPNLAAVCKLVFKVSRCDKNDELFLEDNVLDLLLERLGGASLVEDAEASVYGYGALRFVTTEPKIVSRVLQLGGLDLMVLHMKLINLMAQEGGGHVPEQALQALFQLTGALRNVAEDAGALSSFVTSGALAQLCRTLQLFSSEPDLMSNVVRTLSITSTHEACCDALVVQPGCLRACVALLERFPQRQDMVVRLSYALGNIMARSEHARRQLLGDDSTRASVLSVLGRCLSQEPQPEGSSPGPAKEDVLVKVLRVVANASLSEAVGPSLADSPEVLDTLLDVLGGKTTIHSEELVLGALLTLNNLSFYPSTSSSRLAEQQINFAQALLPLLSDQQCLEATVEALRVFGNLSRWKNTRDFLAKQEVNRRVAELIAGSHSEVQYVAVGMLVNLLADPDVRHCFRQPASVSSLLGVLQHARSKAVAADWQLAGLACQALWNACADAEDVHAVLGIAETDLLVTLLADMLDEERLFGVAEGTTVPDDVAATSTYQLWEEFAQVATNLLERLEGFLESLPQGDGVNVAQTQPIQAL